MMVVYAAFKSRRDALTYAEALGRMGIFAKVVSTPSVVNSSCGLSVRFPAVAGNIAKRVLSRGEYATFLGFFKG